MECAIRRKLCTQFFFSNNFNDEPDFKAPLRDTLDGILNGCYIGSILDYFDTYEKAMIHMMSLRAKAARYNCLQNKVRLFIDLDNLNDDTIDEIQEIIEETNNQSDDDEEQFVPPDAVMPLAKTSKIDPSIME